MSRFEYAVDSARVNPSVAKAIIRNVFERARKARLNMVFFQVRGNADAFYNSTLEPWSAMLSGSLGQDPGWDPLAFAVEEAHRLGLELHAWINAFPVWRGPGFPQETTPRPVVLAHPDWIVCDSTGSPMPLTQNGYAWGTPGNPAMREHIINVVKEIVGQYDVDGVHFDYVRYPEGSRVHGFSRDSVSVARFQSLKSNPAQLPWEYWQREQINDFIAGAYDTIISMKHWIKVSAAVIGKYDGSGWTSYHAVFQDPYRWMELEKIDFIVPMVYWQRSHPTHPFVPLIAQWHDRVAHKRQVLPGLSTGLQHKFGWRELSAQIHAVRKQGLPGVVFFASGGL
ncbi:MAG: family 10 glycosylhydrolase, partial [Bacteroidota bacterium]